jgi:uncharacterized membrane protein YfcA
VYSTDIKQPAASSQRTNLFGWVFTGILFLVAALVFGATMLSMGSAAKPGFVTFVVVGFLAQIIDGSLGMAYKVSSTTFLLSTGVAPAVASASVHTASVFTTLVSGLSHLKLGNVDKTVFKQLVIPGMIGGITGAYVLSNVPAEKIKPLVSAYLVIMGLRILWKAVNRHVETRALTRLFPLGILGGFLDALGGGGWGPIVTTTLVARGNSPRFVIGSVNLAEFFVAMAQTFTFLLAVKLMDYGTVIAGLIVGGVIAAPLAAYACKHLPPRVLMAIVGLLIVGLSLRTIALAF